MSLENYEDEKDGNELKSMVGACKIRERLQQAIRSTYLTKVTQWAYKQIDWSRCELSKAWLAIDHDPLTLAHQFSVTDAEIDEILDALSVDKAIREYARFQNENGKRSVAVSRQRIVDTFPEPRLYMPESVQSIFTELLPRMAGQIEQEILCNVDRFSEDQLHIRLLLIIFLQNCKLTSASLVSQQLQKLTRPIMSIRGTLVRIPEMIPGQSQSAIALTTEPLGEFTPKSSSLLTLAAASIVADLCQNRGVVRRFCGSNASLSIEHLPPAKQQLVIDGRSRDFAMFEANGAICLSIAAAEQAIRCCAEHLNIDNFKNDRPVPAFTLSKRIAASGSVSDSVKSAAIDLFGPKRGNIRNRMAHAAWVDTEAKYLEAVLDHDGKFKNLPSIDSSLDQNSPRKVAIHAAKLMHDIISNIEATGIEFSSSCEWIKWFNLDDLVEFGLTLSDDFLGSESEFIARLSWVNSVLHATIPVVDIYHRVAMIGGFKDRASHELDNVDFLVAFYFAQTVFEALFRTVASLHGRRILKVSKTGNGTLNVNYKMLSTDPGELIDANLFHDIVSCVAVVDRPVATKCLISAIALRDAFAHGAIIGLTAESRDSIVRIYWKTVELLCESIRHRLTQNVAYGLYLRRGIAVHGFDEVDWYNAEREVDNTIRDHDESPRKYEVLRSMGLIMPDDARFRLVAF